MNEYRYILEQYKGMKSRYRCPECNDTGKTFVRYVDRETGQNIADHVGRCNRESNCGYHYTPKQYFQDNKISFDEPKPKPYYKPETIISKAVSFILVSLFEASLKGYDTNHFTNYLVGLFGVQVTEELISKYFIATSKHWNGATVFWQIDIKGKIRTGKIMLYNPTTGKRIKDPFNYIAWVHKTIKQPDFELKQCMFGEHLLQDKTKPVAIVESEKTAIIASVYLPQFIWLATGGIQNLSNENCKALQGRSVVLFPDMNGFEKWNKRIQEMSINVVFFISDLLENNASENERQQGLDLADYLIKFDYGEFVLCKLEMNRNIQEQEMAKNGKKWQQLQGQTGTNRNVSEPMRTFQNQCEPIKTNVNHFEVPKCLKMTYSESENWEQEINELQLFFAQIELPTQPVKINSFSTITSVSNFIESHFTTLKTYKGNKYFLPHLDRLRELKQYLKQTPQ